MSAPEDAAGSPPGASSGGGRGDGDAAPTRRRSSAAGRPGPEVLHSERVWPTLGTWVAAPALAALSGLAAAPLGAVVVAAVVAVVAGLVVLGLVRSSPSVLVTTTELRAGSARIPRSDLGAASGYDGEDARRQRGPVLDARAHLVMRGWADGVVRVEVVDPDDPTPYWLVSTHRPAELARALQPSTAA